MKSINFKEVIIDDFREIDEEWRVWFLFSIENQDYRLFLFKNHEEDTYSIEHIFHFGGTCPFCDRSASDKAECEVLHKQKEAFFYRLIKESKNRLRWLNKKMEWEK